MDAVLAGELDGWPAGVKLLKDRDDLRLGEATLVHRGSPCWPLGRKSTIIFGLVFGAQTRMTLDTYGHVMAGAQRNAADRLDRLFAPSPFGGQMVVKEATIATDLPGQPKRKFNGIRAFNLVEMRGLEPLTPCLQSRCSTS
jgi:hypothetical protein